MDLVIIVVVIDLDLGPGNGQPDPDRMAAPQPPVKPAPFGFVPGRTAPLMASLD